MKQKNNTYISFNDLLFNILIVYVMLFFLVFLLINPITTTNETPRKAEIMILVEWPKEFNDDVDIWLEDPEKDIIGFKRKENDYIHLDRDNLGNDDYTEIDGEKSLIEKNREIINLRGYKTGIYNVNIHMYIKRVKEQPTPITVTVMDLNPFNEAYIKTFFLEKTNDVKILPSFSVDSDGNIEDVFENNRNFIPIMGDRNDY